MKPHKIILLFTFIIWCSLGFAQHNIPEPPKADLWENGLPFNVESSINETSSYFVSGLGLVSQDNVIIPYKFQRLTTVNERERKSTYYVTRMTHDTSFTSTGQCPYNVVIKRLSIPNTLNYNGFDHLVYNLTGQEIYGLEDLYIPSLDWLFMSKNCFRSEKEYDADSYDGFTIWIGECNNDDAYPLTELTVPTFYDGQAYEFQNIKNLKTLDLTNLLDVSKIKLDGCKDLEELKLNHAVEVLPSIKDCDALTNFSIPESVYEIPAETWLSYQLDDLTLPAALQKITETPRATLYYRGGGPTAVVMPGNLEEVCENAFGKNLEHAVVGARVRNLDGVFRRCEYLKDVVIGSRVVNISAGEFKSSTVLQTVESLNPEPPESTADIFDAVTYLYATLYVPVGSKTKYAKAPGWRKFAKIEEREYPVPSPIDRLSKTALHTYPGENVTIDVKLKEGSNPELTYKVDDESIASVEADGTVNGLTSGQTIVSVIPDGNEDQAVKCVVTVIERPIAIECIEADPISIRIYDEQYISCKIYPVNATIKNIKWVSHDPNTAYVTFDGQVIGIRKGETKIYGYALDGSGNKVEIPVTVDYALSVNQPVVNSNGINVHTNGLSVVVSRLNPAEPVSLFSMDGSKIADTAASPEGSVLITAPSTGIFILKTSGEVYKIYLH